MDYEIILGSGRISINSALSYQSVEHLKQGQIVLATLRNKETLGFVVGVSTLKIPKTKQIAEVLPYKLTTNQLKLFNWLKNYYPSSLSAIAQLFMPPKIHKNEMKNEYALPKFVSSKLPKLTKEQKQAYELITTSNQTNYLLHGRTGSGKTRLYAELVKDSIKLGKSAVILTPEIGLTTPLIDYFTQLFGKNSVISFHSQMTALQKYKSWHAASLNGPKIIVGPRSALFLPLESIGVIIIDESHDQAYKQEQQPYYHASRVATKLANLHNAKCVFGTATPLVGDYYAFKEKKLPIIEMNQLAIKNSYNRTDEIIDIRNRSEFSKSQLLSEKLVNEIGKSLKTKNQVILYLNRRGSARTVLCQKCGWHDICPNCDLSLTYHSDKNKVLCHVCSFNKSAPLSCPECKSLDIIYKTPGTKTIENEVLRLFPHAKVGRYDKDSASGSKLYQSFKDIELGNIDILVGTQILSKGLDLPKLNLIGLLQADSSLMLPDFSATERTYQQISQVAGRLARGHGNGTLILQTYYPNKDIIKWSLNQNYQNFYNQEISERIKYKFPPSVYMLIIMSKKSSQSGAIKSINKIKNQLQNIKDISVGNPAPCFHEKKSNNYYWQIVLKSKNRDNLLKIIDNLPSQTLYNIDPSDLL